MIALDVQDTKNTEVNPPPIFRSLSFFIKLISHKLYIIIG